MMKVLLTAGFALVLSAPTVAGDYVLKVSKIEAKKTPQSGDWSAGVSLRQKAEPDNRDSWHGGEGKFEGEGAVLPVDLELGGLDSGEPVTLFVGIDDDGEDAGGDNAEDKLEIEFKVFSTRSKERVYDYAQDDWSLRIHYTLEK